MQTIASRLTLVDVSSASIEQCKKRLAGATNVRYSVSDGRTLPFADTEFDRVWASDVFVHIGERHATTYLREIARAKIDRSP